MRLVGDNVEPGIYKFKEAMQIADELDLDLVEISPSANPPVCKVIDYSKFLYQLKKQSYMESEYQPPLPCLRIAEPE